MCEAVFRQLLLMTWLSLMASSVASAVNDEALRIQLAPPIRQQLFSGSWMISLIQMMAALDTEEAAAAALIATDVASRAFLKANPTLLSRFSLTLPCPSSNKRPKDCSAVIGASTRGACKNWLVKDGKAYNFFINPGHCLFAIGFTQCSL